MSKAQEALIRMGLDPSHQVIVMLDEDEVGKAARNGIGIRLAQSGFVKIHVFDRDGISRRISTLIASECSPDKMKNNPPWKVDF